MDITIAHNFTYYHAYLYTYGYWLKLANIDE